MIYRFGSFSLDTELLEMRKKDTVVTVEPQVFSLLAYLIENRDRVLTKDDLIENVWGGRIVSDGSLTTSINAARRAVGDDGKAQAVIRTYPRRGFRFVADIDADLEPLPLPADEAQLTLPDKPSIAVLPFDNLSGEPDQDYFSDGITEDIITEISKISGLFVIGRHSAFTFKGKSATLRQIGRELGVKYVLEGSVRKAGNRLRISSQLVDASIDQQLWAERFDRELEDIFAVQEEVARSVASALEVVLKPGEGQRLSRVPTENLEAYDLYLRTRTTLWPPTRENLLTARSAYRRITEKDPAFSGGFAGQSMTHSLPVIFVCSDQPADDARLALELADTAVELGPDFALSHSALALAHTVAEQHDNALKSAREAVKLQPGDPDVLAYSAWPRFFAGCADEAYDAVAAANRLDPNYVGGPYLNILGITCFCGERYEEAITAFRKNIERGGPLGAPAVVFHTAACSAAGRMNDASDLAQDIFKFCPDFTLSTYRMLHLFKNQSDSDHVVGALRKIGLPE